MIYADDIKVRVLSWLLPQLKDLEIVATELPFSDGAFKADLAIVSPTRLDAIEIKGPRDDLRKLDRQLSAYQSMFLSVSVVVEERQIAALRPKLDRSVGIVALTSQGVMPVRAPRNSARLEKPSAAAWIHALDLRRALTKVGYAYPKNATVEWLRAACVDVVPRRDLSDLAMACVFRRSQQRYEHFVNELGRTMTLDDVRTLGLAHTISEKGG